MAFDNKEVIPNLGTQADTASTPDIAPAPPVKVGGKDYSSWDEVGKAYENLQSEHGKWTQKYGDLERQYRGASEQAQLADQWNQWWQRVQPLWGDDVEALLRQKLSGGKAPQAQGQAQQSATMFEGYEALAPQEQYNRMSEAIQGRLSEQLSGQYNERLGQLAQAVQQTLSQKEQWYQSYLTNHLALMRRALEQKLQDPTFDVDAVMENAAKAIGGQIDPIQLGQQLIAASTSQSRIDQARKEAYEQAKRDIELAQKNKQIESVPAMGGAPVFKFSPGTSEGGGRRGLASMRQSAAESLFKKFGADLFRD